MQPNGVNLWNLKLSLFDLKEFIVWNIYGIDFKENGVRKSEFVAKTHALWKFVKFNLLLDIYKLENIIIRYLLTWEHYYKISTNLRTLLLLDIY